MLRDGTARSRVAPPTSIINQGNSPHKQDHMSIWWKIFFHWGSHFPSDSRLCQVDKNQPAWSGCLHLLGDGIATSLPFLLISHSWIRTFPEQFHHFIIKMLTDGSFPQACASCDFLWPSLGLHTWPCAQDHHTHFLLSSSTTGLCKARMKGTKGWRSPRPWVSSLQVPSSHWLCRLTGQCLANVHHRSGERNPFPTPHKTTSQ